MPRAPGALRPAAERPDRGHARAARTRRRTARATRAATRRTGGCSRTSAASAVDIMLDNETGEPFHPGAADRCGNGPGFFSNRDIAYVFAPSSRGFGELLVLRGRAPTFADTRPGPAVMPSGQQLALLVLLPVRARDPARDRLPLGRPRERRRATAATRSSSPRRRTRPASARPECGVTWLPWGPQTQGLLIYRHMLPDPSFAAGDPERAGSPAPSSDTMGDYYPQRRVPRPVRATSRRRGCQRG